MKRSHTQSETTSNRQTNLITEQSPPLKKLKFSNDTVIENLVKVELVSFLQQMYEPSYQPQMSYHNIFKHFMSFASKIPQALHMLLIDPFIIDLFQNQYQSQNP